MTEQDDTIVEPNVESSHDDYGPFVHENIKYDDAGFPIPAQPDKRAGMGKVLATLDEKDLPSPLPVCATCPGGLWRVRAGRDKTQLSCFCKVFHDVVFDTAQASVDPFVDCDAVDVAAAEEIRFRLEMQNKADHPLEGKEPTPINKP